MSNDLQSSLFEPSSDPPIKASVGWVESVALGQVSLILCVIAVAFVGALMLTGRMPARRGALVVIGCFILIGAPLIAAALQEVPVGQSTAPPPPETEYPDPREDLEPAHSDPYSGA